MNTKTNSGFNFLMATLVGMLSALPVAAEDIEIYVGQNLGVNEAAPNLLFVIDTSGSMGTDDVPDNTYNANTTYVSCYDSNYVYYNTDRDCGTSKKILLSAFFCQTALDQFTSTGFYTGKYGQWRSNSWRTVSTGNSTSYVECSADQGDHGNGGVETYASNSSGPWSSNSASAINWNSTGSNLTFYSANYKNRQYLDTDGDNKISRIQAVRNAATSLVNSIDNNVNIGLMRFADNGTDGAVVVEPVGPIATTKDAFNSTLANFTAQGGTPLAKALYEAAMYYKGGAVDYGNSAPKSVAGSRTPATTTGANYNSPIDLQCQDNYVIFLTDGEPNSSDTLTSGRKTNIGVGTCPTYYADSSGGTMQHCLPQIATAMGTLDQSSTLAGTQKVSVYTVGMKTNQALLQDTANASKAATGTGAYKSVNNVAELVQYFNEIVADILNANGSFISPAVSVNAFSRTAHRNDLYFSVFKPDNGPHWDGNFKRYVLAFNPTTGIPEIRDRNNVVAVGADGAFISTATSYWSVTADGDTAPEGGAASKLTNTRKVYTYTGTNSNLAHSSNLLHENTAAITATMLGAASAAERTDILKWARGLDVKDNDNDGNLTEARQIMGDPLHGEAVLIQYGGTSSAPDVTAYVPTNDGYLHAIDTQEGNPGSATDPGGRELFAFVPRELLGNLKTHYVANANTTKVYGLDGSVTAWVKDVNKNGVIESGDHAYIYFGMRRGGNLYYALDVTDRANPRLMWTIQGGVGNFAELSETWSQPQLRKVKVNNVEKQVLIFAGGYDTAQDANTTRQDDGIGHAVYIVDAITGARLWWASSSVGADLRLNDMKYSIPSSVATADTDGDNYVDSMYVGDMGGQVFRFDIALGGVGTTLPGLITGGRIADLAANGSAADNRRIYYPPSVANIRLKDGFHRIVSVGTGYREHPLNTDNQDRIYILNDASTPGNYVDQTESDLYDGTSATAGTTITQTQCRNKGWYTRLTGTGEKALAKTVIFGNTVYASTYLPYSAATAASCAPSEGSGKLYELSIASCGVETGDIMDLQSPGIPGDLRIVTPEDQTGNTGGKQVGCIATECDTLNNGELPDLFWSDR